jgi:hypothetical protein
LFVEQRGMTETNVATPARERFAVPAPIYWAVRTVHATAPAWVGLGNLESRALRRRMAATSIDRPIYICGLPRAGTTISLQMLSEHPDVATHRYADFVMPYIPYVWSRVSRLPIGGLQKPQPRIHRDRIAITRDSAEMCEEMLWEHFFEGLYDESRSQLLDEAVSNPAFERFYRDHIKKLLLSRRRTRYASKAIMCALRIAYIRKIEPTARFLLYVRNPLRQLASLVKQDRIWDEIDRDDPRQIEIIEMTAHHEFGRRQVLPNVGNTDEVREVRALLDAGRKVAARARVWAYIYKTVLAQLEADAGLREAVMVVRYEELCLRPRETIDRILEHTGLAAEPFADVREKYAQKLSLPEYYKPTFTEEELADVAAVTDGVAASFGYDRSKAGSAS